MTALAKIAAPRPLTQSELRSLEASVHIADRLRHAQDNRVRAVTLLRMPDSILLERAADFAAICAEAGFPLGGDFIAVRVAALTARRLGSGELPEPLRAQGAYWRQVFAALAGGSP